MNSTKAVKVGVPESEHFLPIYGWHPSRFTKKWKSIIYDNRWTNPSTYVTHRWQSCALGIYDYIISKSILELMWRISLIHHFEINILDSQIFLIFRTNQSITFQLWTKTTICRRFYYHHMQEILLKYGKLATCKHGILTKWKPVINCVRVLCNVYIHHQTPFWSICNIMFCWIDNVNQFIELTKYILVGLFKDIIFIWWKVRLKYN